MLLQTVKATRGSPHLKTSNFGVATDLRQTELRMNNRLVRIYLSLRGNLQVIVSCVKVVLAEAKNSHETFNIRALSFVSTKKPELIKRDQLRLEVLIQQVSSCLTVEFTN